MKKRKRLYIIGAAFIILGLSVYLNRAALASLGFDWFVQSHVEKQLEKTYKPVEGREPKPINVSNKKEEPLGILLLGVDQRANEQGRSDSMIYTVVRPSDGHILMVSIPRDLYVELVGRGKKDKINHAFAFGGAGMSMDTVEKLLDAPIHYYASVNFEGFRDAVDAMGGIALPIEKDIVNRDPNHDHFVVKAGQDLYNGKDALNFMRYREDAGGDMNRTMRHQQFLQALMDKAMGMKQWTKIPELIRIMGDNFSTDMQPYKLVDVAQDVLQSKQQKIYSTTLKGEGRRLQNGGAWYYFADEKDLEETTAMIKNWLDMNTPVSELMLPEKYNQEAEKEVQALSDASNRTE